MQKIIEEQAVVTSELTADQFPRGTFAHRPVHLHLELVVAPMHLVHRLLVDIGERAVLSEFSGASINSLGELGQSPLKFDLIAAVHRPRPLYCCRPASAQ